MRNTDNAVSVLEHVLEYGEVSPVVGLAPSLFLGIVTLKSFEAINPDVEVGDIQE